MLKRWHSVWHIKALDGESTHDKIRWLSRASAHPSSHQQLILPRLSKKNTKTPKTYRHEGFSDSHTSTNTNLTLTPTHLLRAGSFVQTQPNVQQHIENRSRAFPQVWSFQRGFPPKTKPRRTPSNGHNLLTQPECYCGKFGCLQKGPTITRGSWCTRVAHGPTTLPGILSRRCSRKSRKKKKSSKFYIEGRI